MTLRPSLNKPNRVWEFFGYSVRRTAGITALVTVLLLLFCPGYILVQINRVARDDYSFTNIPVIHGNYNFGEVSPGIIFAVTLITTATALIYLFINFAFLYSRSSSDFFHALPLKRSGLLLSRFFASVVPQLVPIFVTYASMGVITRLKNVTGSIKPVLFGLAANIMIVAALCAFSLIFIICAGSVFDLIISYFTFNIGILFLPLIIAQFCNNFLNGFPSSGLTSLFSAVSPFYYGFTKLFAVLARFEKVAAADKLAFILRLVAVTAASLAAALILYNRRKSEKSGVGYAYRFICVVCGFIVGFIGAFGLGIIFSDGKYNLIYWIFAPIGSVLGVVTFGVINNRGFKAVKRSVITGLTSVAAMGVTAVILFTGFFGYSSRIPAAEKIQKATVVLSDISVEFTDSSRVTALHRALYKNGGNTGCGTVYLNYKLKNGKTFVREYGSNDGCPEELLNIYKSPEYADSLRKRLNGKALSNLSLSISESYSVAHYETDTGFADVYPADTAYITPSELDELVEAYLSDVGGASKNIVTGNDTISLDISAIDRQNRTAYYTLYIERSFKNTTEFIKSLELEHRTAEQ